MSLPCNGPNQTRPTRSRPLTMASKTVIARESSVRQEALAHFLAHALEVLVGDLIGRHALSEE